jgi:hypothetical protein
VSRREINFSLIEESFERRVPLDPALQGGVKGYNINETPCRKAPPFRAEL